MGVRKSTPANAGAGKENTNDHPLRYSPHNRPLLDAWIDMGIVREEIGLRRRREYPWKAQRCDIRPLKMKSHRTVCPECGKPITVWRGGQGVCTNQPKCNFVGYSVKRIEVLELKEKQQEQK